MNVYDFDGTIYKGDSTIDFFLFCLRRKPLLIRFLPVQASAILLYKLKKFDKTQLKEKFFIFLQGIKEPQPLIDEFWQKNKKNIYQWYLDQMTSQDIVISASPRFLLYPICNQLGIPRLIASEVDVKTGRFQGKNCRGIEKVQRFKAEFNTAEIDKFYSDSKSDEPLAKEARRPFFVVKGRVLPWSKDVE